MDEKPAEHVATSSQLQPGSGEKGSAAPEGDKSFNIILKITETWFTLSSISFSQVEYKNREHSKTIEQLFRLKQHLLHATQNRWLMQLSPPDDILWPKSLKMMAGPTDCNDLLPGKSIYTIQFISKVNCFKYFSIAV